MKRLALACAGSLALLAMVVAPGSASAQSTVWQRAREPWRFVAEETKRAAETELDRERTDEGNMMRLTGLYDPRFYRQRAREVLEDAGASVSPDPGVRLLYARLLVDLGDARGGAAIIARALSGSLPPDLAADAWNDLALAQARLGDVEGQIASYERAIELEPSPRSRASLMANQAEAFMSRGDVERAIDGYRASLSMRSSLELHLASTTFYSLGVAYDRGGDLLAAVAQVTQARIYDRTDSSLTSRDWIFFPAYDESWFAALGHLTTARSTEDDDVRVAAYEASAVAYEEFVRRAPETDPYRTLAQARAVQVRREAATQAKAKQAQPQKPRESTLLPLPAKPN